VCLASPRFSAANHAMEPRTSGFPEDKSAGPGGHSERDEHDRDQGNQSEEKKKSLRRRNDTTFHACQARGSAIVMAAPPRSRCSVAMLSTSVCPFRNSTKPRSAAAATISRCRSARNHVSSAYCMSLRRGSGLRRCDIDRCDRCPVSLRDSLFLQRAHSHFA
jgi:hypothetical protein